LVYSKKLNKGSTASLLVRKIPWGLPSKCPASVLTNLSVSRS